MTLIPESLLTLPIELPKFAVVADLRSTYVWCARQTAAAMTRPWSPSSDGIEIARSVPCWRRKSSSITPGFASRYRSGRIMSAVKAGRCAAWFPPVAALFVCRPGAPVRRCTIRHGPHIKPDQTPYAAPKRHNFRGTASKRAAPGLGACAGRSHFRPRISVVLPPSVLGSWRKLPSGATKDDM